MSETNFSKLTWLKDVPWADLTGNDALVLISVYNHTDKHGQNAHPGTEKVAAIAGVSTRTVERSLKNLRDRGVLIRTSVGGHRGDQAYASVYSLGTSQPDSCVGLGVDGRNVRTDNQGSSQPDRTRSQPDKMSSQPDSCVGVSEPLTTDPSKTDLLETRPFVETPSAGADDVGKDQEKKDAGESIGNLTTGPVLASFAGSDESSGSAAAPLPADWHVSGVHVNSASRYGLNASEVAEVFKAWAVGEGVRSNNWDRRFGWLLKAIGENFTDCPEEHGMAGLQAYSLHPDNDEWFSEEPYAMKVKETGRRPAWAGSPACWFHARDKAGMTRDEHTDALFDYLSVVDASVHPQRLENGYKSFINARLIAA